MAWRETTEEELVGLWVIRKRNFGKFIELGPTGGRNPGRSLVIPDDGQAYGDHLIIINGKPKRALIDEKTGKVTVEI